MQLGPFPALLRVNCAMSGSVPACMDVPLVVRGLLQSLDRYLVKAWSGLNR